MLNLIFTKRAKILWRVAKAIPLLDALDKEFSESDGNREKEAELAYKAGVLDQHQLNRLKLLWKFAKISGQGRELELEWQRIQQDEHDYKFAFQTTHNDEEKTRYIYKKGIADGIKWCINRFS